MSCLTDNVSAAVSLLPLLKKLLFPTKLTMALPILVHFAHTNAGVLILSSSSSSNTQSTITEVDDLCALDDLDVTSKLLASALAAAHPRASPEPSKYTESLERSDQRSSDNRALPPANADIEGARAFAENLRRADVDPSTMLLYRLTGEIAKLTAERTNPISDPIKI